VTPNMALQRTRRPSLRSGRSLRSLGSPLNAYPLGGVWRLVALLTVVAPSLALGSPLDREIEYRCSGLEAYEIRATYHVDAGGGTIRSKTDPFSIAFSVGPMVEELIPAARRPGLRWMKTEALGKVTFRYGFDVKKKQVHATIIRAPINNIVNLAGLAKDQDRLVAIGRVLATARCTFRDLSRDR
jgi:hypothetical protein